MAEVSSSTSPADDPLGESMRRLLGGFASFNAATTTNTNTNGTVNISGETATESSSLLVGNPVADRTVLRHRSSFDEDTILLTTGVTVANYGDGGNVSGGGSNSDA